MVDAFATPTIVVCATTLPQQLFQRGTFLGQSLAVIPAPIRPKLILCPENAGTQALGLPKVYNRAISSCSGKDDNTILIFCHDDVYLHDWFLIRRLEQFFKQFDLLGVMGCQQALPDQVGWSVRLDEQGQRQFLPFKDLKPSGVINHFNPHQLQPEWLGPPGRDCVLLDGCFLATTLGALRRSKVRFDEAFSFHCYDTAFCRDIKDAGLRIGTAELVVTHASGGGFNDSWHHEAKLYLAKRFHQRSNLAPV